MARRTGRPLVLAVGCSAILLLAVLFQADRSSSAATSYDLKPFAHWVFAVEHRDGTTLKDQTGTLPARLQGSPAFLAQPVPAIVMNHDAAVVVQKTVTPSAPFLPREAFTIVAWVRVDAPNEWGGILGCLQDNGPAEKGFILGYNKSNFYLGVASQNADDGDGKLTYLAGKTAYEPGRWYHVAGSYDGQTMRLFVNGQLDATSTEQSGSVLYADSAPLTIGRYTDANEDYPSQCAIHELLWCDRAVPGEDLLAHFRVREPLAAQPPPVPAGPKWIVEPYLQYATDSTITVMCETDSESGCEVAYGDKFPLDKVARSSTARTLHELKLTGMQPGSKHFYVVSCTDAAGNRLESKPFTFSTAVGSGEAYSFCVIGDTQRNPEITAKVAKLMWERRPHFVLHMGDVVNDGDQKWQWEKDLFKPCFELFSRVPVFPCIGNHEKNHEHYYRYFSLPTPEYYYSFRYGNAEFFSLDTNKPVGPGSEQFRWLDQALARSEATWKICYHHHPCYSSDSDDYGNTWKGVSTRQDKNAAQLIPLYEKHNVDLVMNGHIHLYERTWPVREGRVDLEKGVVYLTSGGGGGKLEDFEPTPAFFKNQGRVDYHHCYFTVFNGTLECRVFDHEGRLFDQFSMKKSLER